MKRLFPILLVATVIVGGALAFAIWRATPTSPEGYVASGKKYFEEKKYDEAVLQLLNALQLDAKNRDARYNLAQIYLSQGDRASAAGHLTSLLEYYPDDAEANVMLGNIHLAAGSQDQKNLREASEIAKKVLGRQPDFIPALLLSGNVAAGLGDFPSAVQAFNRILTVDPQNASAYVNLGAIHVLRKALPEAERAFLMARKLDPKNKTAILSLTNFYRASKQHDKAEAVLNDALSLLPDDLMLDTVLVELYSQTGRLETGVALLKGRIARNPQDPDTYFVLSDLYKAKDMPQQSRAALEDAKKALPDNQDVSIKLASSFLATDRTRARAEVDQVLKASPAHRMANLLLGEIQFFDGDIDKAEVTLSKDILVRSQIPEAAFFLGTVALRKGQTDKAVENFQKAVILNPQYLVARVALGELLYGRGNIAGARGEVDAALSIQRSFIPARILKVAVDRAEDNFAAAETELASLVSQAPDNPQVYQQLALTQAARGRFSDAERSFQRVLELQPANSDALRGLVDVLVRTKQTEKAVRAIQALPDDRKGAFHYELLGIAYSSGGRNAEAEAAFKKAIEKEPKRAGSEALLAKHYISNGRMAEGLAQLDEFARKVPNAAMAHGAKGLMFQSKGQLAEAKNSYELALKADPNYEPAANNLAYLLAEEGQDLDRALGFAQTARRLRPDSASVADTLGWVYYKLGNHRQAREQLTFAVSRDPENPVLQYHLGMIYRANIQNREAEVALKKALSIKQAFKERPLAEAELKVVQQGN